MFTLRDIWRHGQNLGGNELNIFLLWIDFYTYIHWYTWNAVRSTLKTWQTDHFLNDNLESTRYLTSKNMIDDSWASKDLSFPICHWRSSSSWSIIPFILFSYIKIWVRKYTNQDCWFSFFLAPATTNRHREQGKLSWLSRINIIIIRIFKTQNT